MKRYAYIVDQRIDVPDLIGAIKIRYDNSDEWYTVSVHNEYTIDDIPPNDAAMRYIPNRQEDGAIYLSKTDMLMMAQCLARHSQKLQAIKLVRAYMSCVTSQGIGLREAKDFVDSLAAAPDIHY